MKLKRVVICAIAVSTALPAFAADRLTDRDVKSLVERIQQDRDQFEDALDGKLKKSVIRGASGEVDVDRFLDDFQENANRLNDRLKPGYAASAEVGTLLRQGNAIERFFAEQPSGTKGASEWNRLSADLKSLATAYGADFPIADNAPVRRIGDGEIEKAMDFVAEESDHLKGTLDKELKKDNTVTSDSRKQIVDQARQLSEAAKTLRDRIKDGKPSSAEAESVIAQAGQLQTAMQGHQLPASATALGGFASQLLVLKDAYGLSRPQ